MNTTVLHGYRENGNKIHELLYNNLLLLTQLSPASSDFHRIFRKDMFVKNNKAAFFEVVYYLLNLLNPERTKKKLTSWPPYDIKREQKFRSEIRSYINELNMLYESSAIPAIMASHLISPGGFKFTKVMLKLSQLVVFEHLNNLQKVELHCPTLNDRTRYQTANLNKLTRVIEQKIMQKADEFESVHYQMLQTAQNIAESLFEADKKIPEARMDNKKARAEFDEKYPTCPSLESLQAKVNSLNSEWKKFQTLHQCFVVCDNILTYLNSTEAVIEHKKTELKFPNEILHLVKNGDELDLVELYHGLSILLERKALELPNISSLYIQENSEKLKEFSARYLTLDNKLSEKRVQIKIAIEELLENIKWLENVNDTQRNIGVRQRIELSDETLGVRPLCDN